MSYRLAGCVAWSFNQALMPLHCTSVTSAGVGPKVACSSRRAVFGTDGGLAMHTAWDCALTVPGGGPSPPPPGAAALQPPRASNMGIRNPFRVRRILVPPSTYAGLTPLGLRPGPSPKVKDFLW